MQCIGLTEQQFTLLTGTLCCPAPAQAATHLLDDAELVRELVTEAHSISSSSGVGSPEVCILTNLLFRIAVSSKQWTAQLS
jgi:hypothetical protein